MTGLFLVNSTLLGVGLAMDAFSVSMANGLNEPGMSGRKMSTITGAFAGFQFLMPMIGWFCVRKVAETFRKVQPFIPWIAFGLLLFIGGKMILETLKGESREQEDVGAGNLLVQGIATSIDALSVGFTIANYRFEAACLCSGIIAVVTFILCAAGVSAGRKAGTRLAGKAQILGGLILIAIGLEILLF